MLVKGVSFTNCLAFTSFCLPSGDALSSVIYILNNVINYVVTIYLIPYMINTFFKYWSYVLE